MSLKNKSVMVTGGAGFIGSHLVDRIIKEAPEALTVVDNYFLGNDENLVDARAAFPGLKVFRESAVDTEAMARIMKEEGTDVVFNLAVIPLPASLDRPRWVFEENVAITLSVCELAREGLFDTLVHFSSSEAYGSCVYSPMSEDHPLLGTTLYASSKAASDQAVFSYITTFGIDASIIRPFNNYGPRQNDGSYAGVIPVTIKRILGGQPPVIYGDGRQTRDYLYVTDTADAAVKVYDTKATRNKVLNIASGKEVSIGKLIRSIAKHMGYEKDILYEGERPADVQRHIANIFMAEDLIGFKPTIDFDEGLARTVEWYVARSGADQG